MKLAFLLCSCILWAEIWTAYGGNDLSLPHDVWGLTQEDPNDKG